MNDRLRVEYEKYLAHYCLKPRKIPSREAREEAQREAVRVKYEEAKSRGDPTAESILKVYEENRERYLNETRHPATIEIEQAAEEVEATIHSVPAFAEKYHDDVYVGEFPTGSVNCETVKVNGGYLVLVNSGTLMMLQQVVTFLCRGDPDDRDSEKSLKASAGVAAVLTSYVEEGDPYYGPKPLNGGWLGVLTALFSTAATKFVIAHEYGHILANHFSETDPERIALETPAGAIDILKKSHEQEFEADELGYRLTLGVEAYDQFDLTLIDAGLAHGEDIEAWHAGLRQKCLIAAPFVSLAVDGILGRFAADARQLGNKITLPDTHPAAADRISRMLKLRPSTNPRYSGFTNFPFMLTTERIVTAMMRRLFPQHS
jgi:hypothetical protein